jgi:hypothetical protein
MARGETVEFKNAKCVKETDAALLIKFEDREKEVWIPKSQVDDASEVYAEDGDGSEGTLIITEWIATQKGLA